MKAVADRLREPSTWAAIAVLLGVFGVPLPEGIDETMARAVDAVASAAAVIAAVAGAVLKENGHAGGA